MRLKFMIKRNIMINDVVCTENSFVNFNERGRIFVNFSVRIQRKNFVCCVAHFYNCGTDGPTKLKGVDVMFRTFDPVI